MPLATIAPTSLVFGCWDSRGVVVRGGIERHVTINLVALRAIVGANDGETAALRKYLLALSLLTATTDIDMFLREGCNLRIADAKDDWKIVPRRGEKQSVDLNSEASMKLLTDYATAAYARLLIKFVAGLRHEIADRLRDCGVWANRKSLEEP